MRFNCRRLSASAAQVGHAWRCASTSVNCPPKSSPSTYRSSFGTQSQVIWKFLALSPQPVRASIFSPATTVTSPYQSEFRRFQLSPGSSSPQYRTAGSPRGIAPANVRGHFAPSADPHAQGALPPAYRPAAQLRLLHDRAARSSSHSTRCATSGTYSAKYDTSKLESSFPAGMMRSPSVL